jgi:hypothetical protein
MSDTLLQDELLSISMSPGARVQEIHQQNQKQPSGITVRSKKQKHVRLLCPACENARQWKYEDGDSVFGCKL